MLKEDGSNSPKQTLGMRCGECLHFKKGPPKFHSVCINLGVQSFAKAPNCFTPNVALLNTVSHDIVSQLGLIAKDLSPVQLRLLSYVFKHAGVLRKVELKFGQPIFFSLGSDYLSHYFRGYVLHVSDDRDYVFVTSCLNKTKYQTFLTLPIASVLKGMAFKETRKRLVQSGRISLKSDTKYTGKLPLAELLSATGCLLYSRRNEVVDADYIPPTLETAPAEWLNRHAKSMSSIGDLFDSPSAGSRKKPPVADAPASSATSDGRRVTIRRSSDEDSAEGRRVSTRRGSK